MQHQKNNNLLSLVIIALLLFELITIYTGSKTANYIASAMVVALPILGFRDLRLREFYILTASIILTVCLFLYTQKPFEVIIQGLERAGFLAGFILLMGVLRNAAITSPAILECGKYITRQPPRRRFLGVMLGSHTFSSLLNLGALSLLVPIIQRGLRHDKPEGAPLNNIALISERRQITAIMRGFAWFLIWSPTAVTQAVLPSLLIGVNVSKLMIIGFFIAMIMMLIAWVEDQLRWGPLRKRLIESGKYPYQSTPPFPKKYFIHLGIVCTILIGCAFLIKYMTNVSFVSGIMLSAPVILVCWVYVQSEASTKQEKILEAKSRFQNLIFHEFPSGIRETIAFASAGFIGTIAAYLIPQGVFGSLLNIEAFPAWLIMLELSVLVLCAGQLGLSPVTMAVFLGTAMAQVDPLPVDITYIALSIACGISLSTLATPFSAASLMLSRVSGYSTQTVSWKWNLQYTLISLGALMIIYMILTKLF